MLIWSSKLGKHNMIGILSISYYKKAKYVSEQWAK